jgi:hypothetical protein
MVNCKICEKEFDLDKQLHSHLRAHKLRMAEYYQTHFPRYDVYDKKIIKFKNKKQYFESDFNSRTNLRLWLKSITEEEAKEYCSKLLSDRKEQKELIYSPTQVELRSLTSPPMQYFNEVFGWDGYYKLCSSLGYKNKHKIFNDIVSGAEYDKPEYVIYVDTREQKPLKFEKRKIQVKKLDYGDYTFSDSRATCNCYIERKSLSDFIGTMSAGYERFNNEIKRATENEAYLIVLVEETLSKATSFQFLPYISKKIKATPEFIFHRVRALIQKYPNIQFLFVNGRKESSRVMERIFTSGCVHRQADLQLAYDLKKL